MALLSSDSGKPLVIPHFLEKGTFLEKPLPDPEGE
jgi:hypothetical protein